MKKLLFYCALLLGLGSCGQVLLSYELKSEKESLKIARRNTSIFLRTSLDTSYSSIMTKIPLKKFKKVSVYTPYFSKERFYDTLFLEQLIRSKYIKKSYINLTFYEGKLDQLDRRLCELPNIHFVSLSQSEKVTIKGKKYYNLKKVNPLNFEKVTTLDVNNKDLDWSTPVPWDYFAKIERLSWEIKYSCLKKKKEEAFPDKIVKLSELKSLYLDSNCSHNENVEYLSLPKKIAQLKNLENLHLNNYIFNSLPKEIGALKKLRDLQLDHFKAERFPREVFGLEQLRFFSYTHGQLDTFPIELLKLKELGVLELSHTDLEVLPETLGEDLPRLHSLNLEHNKLKKLPKDIGEQCPELFRLNLSHNEMTSFPIEVIQIKKIFNLDLSHNQITSLPKELTKLRGKLRRLNLKGNPIPSKEIEALWKKMPNLRITF